MPCIFCRADSNLTREHLFPAFMGGKIEVPDGSCDTCNGTFGRCESAVRDSTKFLLNLLQIQNRNQEVPEVKLDASIRGMDFTGIRAFRDGAGQINLGDVVIPIAMPDGRIRKEGFFISPESGEKFAEKNRARGNQVTEQPVPAEVVIDASCTQTTSFAFSIDARRMAAKIALTAIACKYGVPFAMSTHFDDIRKWLRSESIEDLGVKIFSNELFMTDHIRTAHEHSVICYLSAGMQKGWAVVTLFGGLTYIVDVSRSYTERSSRQFSIFYDAAGRMSRNPIVLADEFTLLGHVLSPATKFENPEAMDAQWFPLIRAYCDEIGVGVDRVSMEK